MQKIGLTKQTLATLAAGILIWLGLKSALNPQVKWLQHVNHDLLTLAICLLGLFIFSWWIQKHSALRGDALMFHTLKEGVEYYVDSRSDFWVVSFMTRLRRSLVYIRDKSYRTSGFRLPNEVVEESTIVIVFSAADLSEDQRKRGVIPIVLKELLKIGHCEEFDSSLLGDGPKILV